MGCYYTLCHNTYAYSLLFYKVYIKRENAGSWDSGLEKEQILETYSTQLQKSWNFMEVIFRIYKKILSPKISKGGHPPSTRVGGAPPASWAPWQASGAHLLLYEVFRPGKNQKEAFGTKRRRLEAEPGETNLVLRRSYSTGETSLREGEIITIVITIDPLSGRGSISINIFTSTISSKTLGISCIQSLSQSLRLVPVGC